MLLKKTEQSDTAPIFLTVQNDESIWEYVYHKYAPMMYGIMLQMTGDKNTTAEIFKAVFLELKEKEMIAKIHRMLYLEILRHTYELTLKHLKAHQIPLVNAQPFDENYPLINQYCFEQSTLKEAATKSAMSDSEMLQQLRAEFNRLRNLSPENVGIM